MNAEWRGTYLTVPSTEQRLPISVWVWKGESCFEFLFFVIRGIREPCSVSREVVLVKFMSRQRTHAVCIETTLELIQYA